MVSEQKIQIGDAATAKAISIADQSALLTLSQFMIVALLGVLGWFCFALFVRYGAEAGFFGGVASFITFILSLPVGWLTVEFFKRAASLGSAQTVSGLAVATSFATFCDAIALTWTPLYGLNAEKVLPGAAWILWGVGVILGFAYLDMMRKKAQ